MTGESTAARPGDSTDSTPATTARPGTGRGGSGAGPWAETGPDAAWWRGDPAATAARFASAPASEPAVPPAPTVSLTPEARTAPPTETEADRPGPVREPVEPDPMPTPVAPGPAALGAAVPGRIAAPAEPAPAVPADPPAPSDDAPRAAEFVKPAPAPTDAPTRPGTDLPAPRAAAPIPAATDAPDPDTPDPDGAPTATTEPAMVSAPVAAPDVTDEPEPADAPEAGKAPEPTTEPEPADEGSTGGAGTTGEPEAAERPEQADEPEPAHGPELVHEAEPVHEAVAGTVPLPAGGHAPATKPDPAGTPEGVRAEPDPEPAVVDGDSGTGSRRDGVEPTIGVESAQLELPAQPVVVARPVPAVPDGGGRATARAAVPAARAAEPARTAPADGEPFWLPTEDVPGDGPEWPGQRMRAGRRQPATAAPRRGKVPRPPRRPIAGLASLVLLALVATFFAWVSAEPLWLALGRGSAGTATVTNCAGDGVGQRCEGAFTSTGGTFTSGSVRLLGVAQEQRSAGTQVSARMVDSDSGTAYVAGDTATLHLRWALGLTLVLLCGVGIVWATGALRLTDRRSRRLATLTSLAAPLLLTIGFLAATF
ncbi:hypothetical protein AB0M79_12560 [Polymorphospora sp. NPDC051019]|uniref:hypothetical protein n=1 Tax=Polymorphospora sp. NPDC051019 TaxID=3155725 RepID=UPI00343D628B